MTRRINVLKVTKKASAAHEKILDEHLYYKETGKKHRGNCHVTSDGKVFSYLNPCSKSARLTWVKPKAK